MGEAYKTILSEGRDEFTVSRSRFIGWSNPVPDEEGALAFIETIRKRQWDASHNVWAYRIGASRERYSDDGEPQGTAGLPILSVIRKEGIRDAVVVVARYFGGVKLGAGGLIRAYTRGAKIALEAGKIIQRRPFPSFAIKTDYPYLGVIQREFAARGYLLKDTIYQERVAFTVLVPPEEKEALLTLVGELTAGNSTIAPGPEVYLEDYPGKGKV